MSDQHCNEGLCSSHCVPGFPASPLGCAVELDRARGSVWAGIGGSLNEKITLGL